MYRRKKIYAKLYGKYINTNSNFEKHMFNYFKSMYEQKLQDPDFNIYIEKCKLTLQANGGSTYSSLGIYVSNYISLATFLLGTILGKYILLSISLAIFILLSGFFASSIMVQASSKVNVCNIALIALDAACNEKLVI